MSADRRRGLVAVDGNSHDLRAGARQRRDLLYGPRDIGGIGIGHRLHDNGCAAADGHLADLHGNGLMPSARPENSIIAKSIQR